jgi:steroid delta-isomerase-like uncharacterized protein
MVICREGCKKKRRDLRPAHSTLEPSAPPGRLSYRRCQVGVRFCGQAPTHPPHPPRAWPPFPSPSLATCLSRPNVHGGGRDERATLLRQLRAVDLMGAQDRMAARLAIVDRHIRHENEHDLTGIMRTFGPTARFDDEPFDAHHVGRENVRTFYAGLLQALPSLTLDVRQTHAAPDAVVAEVIVRGRHLGPWRGLPPTGREIALPLCGIFTFDSEDSLAGERAYYDRATLLRQLGVFHEPDGAIGRIATMIMHPLTMARVLSRKIRRAD